MNRKYSAPDGIRGLTNSTALTAEIAMKAGMAAGRVFTRGDHRHRVVIGKDNAPLRLHDRNPPWSRGFTSVGMDVFQFGPLPTPAVAMLTRSLRADIGVMITASHNKYQDNGIKFFGPDGQKLSDAREAENRGADDVRAGTGPGPRRPDRPRQAQSMTARRAISNSPSAPFRAICGWTGFAS